MLLTLTLPGTVEFFVSIGLPAWLAYTTLVAEAVGGVALILGVQTRWVALALSPFLLGATWAHAGNGWMFCVRERRLGIPTLSVRALHRAGNARRWRLRPLALATERRNVLGFGSGGDTARARWTVHGLLELTP